MKKIISLILAVFLIAGLFAIPAFSEEAAPEEAPANIVYVKDGAVINGLISAGNNVITIVDCDVVKFGFKNGFDPMINITFDKPTDTSEYPILAFKVQRTGTNNIGQVFYNEPGQGAVGGKVRNFNWAGTEEWQWIKVDMTGCGNIGYLRFDVFDSAEVDCTGMIAAFAFFRSEAEADAYAESDAGKALGANTGTLSVGEEIQHDANSRFPLYDIDGKVNTGWWFHPYHEGISVSASFESPVWFNKMWVYAYCSSNPCPILVTLLDEDDNELFSAEKKFSGNDEFVIDLGQAIHPGYYTVVFESVELDEDVAAGVHFVLGSAPASDDIEIEFINSGAAANGDTQDAPAIQLLKCDADPDYTEKPTATPKPTAAPTEAPTPVPTEVKTDGQAADPTEVQTAEGENKSDPSGDKKGGNTGLIVGIIAGAVVLVCVVIAVVSGLKKKNKSKK